MNNIFDRPSHINPGHRPWNFDPQPGPSNYRSNGNTSSDRQRVNGPYGPPHTNNTFLSSGSVNPMMDTAYDDRGLPAPPPLTTDSNFDIIEWHPAYQSCQRYFLDHAQHEPATQALCALINIRLPFQWLQNPIHSSQPPQPQRQSQPSNFLNTPGYGHPSGSRSNSTQMNSPNRASNANLQAPVFISLLPYLRRLCITGFDKPPILHGLFGDDYTRGILPHLDCERRNYLFASKSAGWATCKSQYDSGSGDGAVDETVPFMKPLDEASAEELAAAEKAWSKWLAMEDWMVGPRAPSEEGLEQGQVGSNSGRQGQGQGQSQGQSGGGYFAGQGSGRGPHPRLPDGL